jgi:hypothetical protein
MEIFGVRGVQIILVKVVVDGTPVIVGGLYESEVADVACEKFYRGPDLPFLLKKFWCVVAHDPNTMPPTTPVARLLPSLFGSPLLPFAPETDSGCGGVGVALKAINCGAVLKQEFAAASHELVSPDGIIPPFQLTVKSFMLFSFMRGS